MHEPQPRLERPELFARLLANRDAFLSFLERRVGDRGLSEDILQDALVRGIDKLGQLREEESVTGWFYRVLRNAVVDHMRRRASEQRKLSLLAAELARYEPAESLEPELDARELSQAARAATRELESDVCACVTRLAATLKPEYADMVQRIDVEGMPVKQVAEALGITPNNAAVRVFRAREALRKRVRECCGACADNHCATCDCEHE